MNKLKGKDVEWDPEPPDDQTWWRRSHCGPGSLDGTKLCECDKTGEECARASAKHIKETHGEFCGCSGFFCYNCGLFYSQDSCLETYGDEYETASGKGLEKREDGYLYCSCEAKLFLNSLNGAE